MIAGFALRSFSYFYDDEVATRRSAVVTFVAKHGDVEDEIRVVVPSSGDDQTVTSLAWRHLAARLDLYARVERGELRAAAND